MTGTADITPRERLYQALYAKSLKRLQKRGLDEDHASHIANVVAERASERAAIPDVRSEKAFAAVVRSVCERLAEGKSFYDIIGERPYLATGRIDRLVAGAAQVKPPVPAGTVLAARQATKLERLSGALAVLLMAVALATLGPWYALAVGMVVAAGAETYMQLGLPASLRVATARFRLPRYLGLVALFALGYLGYDWLRDSAHPYAYGVGIAFAALVVAFVVPGLTLAVLVGRRERKWRAGLENVLVEALRQSAGGAEHAGDGEGAD